MSEDPIDVRERVIAAATEMAKLELWSDEGAPPRLRTATAHLLDALTDLRDATELYVELEAEGVAVPLGVLGPDTNEDEILPQTSVWAAYRQLLDAAEIVSAASVVPPWPGEPVGWRPVADGLTHALERVDASEGRTRDAAAKGERPRLVDAEAAQPAQEMTVAGHVDAATAVARGVGLAVMDQEGRYSGAPSAPIEHRRVDGGDLAPTSSSTRPSGASSSARLHQ